MSTGILMLPREGLISQPLLIYDECGEIFTAPVLHHVSYLSEHWCESHTIVLVCLTTSQALYPSRFLIILPIETGWCLCTLDSLALISQYTHSTWYVYENTSWAYNGLPLQNRDNCFLTAGIPDPLQRDVDPAWHTGKHIYHDLAPEHIQQSCVHM